MTRFPVSRAAAERRVRLRIALVVTGFVCLTAVASVASAQEAPDPDPGSDLAAYQARRAEVAVQLESLRAADPEAAEPVERLERVLGQLVDELRRGQVLEERRSEPDGPAGLPDGPFSLAELDVALAALDEAEDLERQERQTVEDAAISLESARAALEDSERRRRQEQDGDAGPGDPDHELAEIRDEIAARTLDLRRAQLANARRALEVQEAITAERRVYAEHVSSRVAPSPQEREDRLRELEERAARVTRERERADLDLAAAQRRWERVQASERSGPDAAVAAELAARRAELTAANRAVALLGEELDRIDRAVVIVERRFALLAQPEPERAVVRDWIRDGEAALEALARERRQDRAALEALVQERGALEGEGTEADADGARWRALQAEALSRTIESYEGALESLRRARQREERVVVSARSRVGGVTFREQLSALRSAAAGAWSFEVLSTEDRSITVGKITIALLTFVAFLVLARLLTRLLGSRVFPRLGLDEGAAHAYQSLAYYALLAIAFLTALRIVNIPLTAFAVVGGALAIGVGFGSQNVVNNFISGLILLAERPIKRGDLVDVDGTYGNVERIGLRSTRVRTGTNIHVIVPNSAFLENKVVNWTHNDPRVRIMVSVGVAYGSPTREVETLMRRALADHPGVRETPRPIILFAEFGDNSLNFEAHFWVRVRSLMDRMQIESDIRFRIDELFREADVVIAFPQRDVHMDAAAPIPVRLVGDGREPTEPA